MQFVLFHSESFMGFFNKNFTDSTDQPENSAKFWSDTARSFTSEEKKYGMK